MNARIHRRAPYRKWMWLVFATAALVIAYALAGFLLVPWIAGRELPRLIEQELGHRSRIGGISFNPFTLRLHANDFALMTPEGRPVLGFSDAVVDLEWRSVIRQGWVLEEARLVDPSLHVDISKEGRLNLASLTRGSGTAGPAQLPRFAIERFSVVNGSVDYEDHRKGYRNRLEHLAIEFSSLSSIDQGGGPYALSGKTPGGMHLDWKGELTLSPTAANGTLALENIALPELAPYLDDLMSTRLVAGHADLILPFRFVLNADGPHITLNGAKLNAQKIALTAPAQTGPLASINGVSLEGIDFDSMAQRASAKALHIGETTVAAAGDKAVSASIGPISIDKLAFDLAKRHLSASLLGVAGIVLDGSEKSKPRASLGQIAINDLAMDLGAQSVSAAGLSVTNLTVKAERDAAGDLDLVRIFSDPSAGKDAASPGRWKASIGSVEITNAEANYIDRTARLPLARALSGLNTSFSLDAGSDDQGFRLRLGAGKLALENLDASEASAVPSAAPRPTLVMAKLSLSGARFDSGSNTLDIDAVRLGSLGANSVIQNGRASLLDLLPAAKGRESTKPLAARVKTFELVQGNASLAEHGSNIGLGLERIALKITDVSSDGSTPMVFNLNTDVKGGGRIALRGHAVPAKGTLEAQVNASAISIAPLQPLLSRVSTLKLSAGDASLSGTLRIGGDDAKFVYSGAAGIADLALDDPTGVRLIGWKSLATESLKATLSPDKIDIDELRLTAPAGRLAIAKDGTSNISRSFVDREAAADRKPAAESKEAAAPIAKPDEPPAGIAEEAKSTVDGAMSVAVRRVRVSQGALDFSDDSLSPGFVAKIYELAGTANGLSTDHDTRSQFALEGRVDEFGYARLSGSVNPFAPRNRSAFRVQLRNIDLANASPYAMRFAGYRIATGHLELDLNYRVRDSLIEGNNNITFQDLTLGEHVDSPDALKLPFELAIALLKDPDGKINLEVPVSGNLDDPQFNLAPLIWKAVGNLIGSIVLAPFRALAHLFGGSSDDNAGIISFDPGRSRLLPPQREKIGHIAQVLAKRPEVKVLIPALYDSEADARAMKRLALSREIGRRAGLAVAEDEEPGAVNFEDKPTRAALRSLYAERFSRAELDKLRLQAEEKARSAGQPSPSVADRVRNLVSGEPQIVDAREFYQSLLRRLRETQPLSPNALAELAGQRARAIESALTAAGADASRIAQTTAEPTADTDAKQVSLHLLLNAR